jgi:hypothetical protein
MKIIRRISIMALLCTIMTMLLTVSAFAGTTDDEAFNEYLSGNATYSTSDTALTEQFIGKLAEGKSGDKWTDKNASKLKSILKQNTTSSGGTAIEVGETQLKVSDAGIQKAKAEIVNAARNASVKESVDNIDTNFSIKADLDTASVSLSGLTGIVSWVVGILVFIVTIAMTLFTSCDICYITMPVFRNKCDDLKTTGGMGTKATSSGDNKLLFVTDDAQYAVQTCSVDTGKNPLWMYLKKRIISFVALALVLFILLTGNIQLIVNVVINIASGIISAISTLGG